MHDLQVILDSHGEVAARICSILRVNGYLEAEAIAEKAMVPAKDTREVRDGGCYLRYVSVFHFLLSSLTLLGFVVVKGSASSLSRQLHRSVQYQPRQTAQPWEYVVFVVAR